MPLVKLMSVRASADKKILIIVKSNTLNKIEPKKNEKHKS